MGHLSDKQLLLGVTGGIAVYKAAELVRLLRTAGAHVRVVMTQAATAFVTPLTFQALSGQPVALDLLDSDQEAAMGHIHLARWADQIIIAPATADFMARVRAGLADDLLTTLCLASEAPITLVPSMNRLMWQNPATQDNVVFLQKRGMQLLGPAIGSQACGEQGPGRMLEPVEIIQSLMANDQAKYLLSNTLKGVSVMVTAGPTREAIDPVRYISNHSSGKMGYAVAEALLAIGAEVILVSGPVNLQAPAVKELVWVESAEQMYVEVWQRIKAQQIFIAAAAVADYTPISIAKHKIKKQSGETVLTLSKTKDILALVGQMEQPPFTVGFAAETDNLEHYAKIKLIDKSIDIIAANWVGRAEGGFDSERNALQVFWPGGSQNLAMTSKADLAQQLVSIIIERFHAKCTTENTGSTAGTGDSTA